MTNSASSRHLVDPELLDWLDLLRESSGISRNDSRAAADRPRRVRPAGEGLVYPGAFHGFDLHLMAKVARAAIVSRRWRAFSRNEV